MKFPVSPADWRLRGAVWALCLIFGLLITAMPAPAQDAGLRPLLDRLERLERDIKTLNLQLARGGSKRPVSAAGGAQPQSQALDGSANARLEVRLGALEEELRAAYGNVEQLSYHLNQINIRIDKLVGDVDFRLSALERMGARKALTQAVPRPPSVQTSAPGGFASEPGSLGTVSARAVQSLGQATGGLPAQAAPQVQPEADPVLPQGTPKERYTYAFGLLRQANYEQAEAALRAFLRSHGEDPLASNARYWLGETHYVRHEFEKAAKVFMEGFQKDPKGSKAPGSLLKLGMSLYSLDKKREACAAFEKLKADFPEAPATIRKTMDREWQRGACG